MRIAVSFLTWFARDRQLFPVAPLRKRLRRR
jgi:hypothetical protein